MCLFYLPAVVERFVVPSRAAPGGRGLEPVSLAALELAAFLGRCDGSGQRSFRGELLRILCEEKSEVCKFSVRLERTGFFFLTVHDAFGLAPGFVGIFAVLRGTGHILIGDELPKMVRGREFQVFEMYTKVELKWNI